MQIRYLGRICQEELRVVAKDCVISFPKQQEDAARKGSMEKGSPA